MHISEIRHKEELHRHERSIAVHYARPRGGTSLNLLLLPPLCFHHYVRTSLSVSQFSGQIGECKRSHSLGSLGKPQILSLERSQSTDLLPHSVCPQTRCSRVVSQLHCTVLLIAGCQHSLSCFLYLNHTVFCTVICHYQSIICC